MYEVSLKRKGTHTYSMGDYHFVQGRKYVIPAVLFQKLECEYFDSQKIEVLDVAKRVDAKQVFPLGFDLVTTHVPWSYSGGNITAPKIYPKVDTHLNIKVSWCTQDSWNGYGSFITSLTGALKKYTKVGMVRHRSGFPDNIVVNDDRTKNDVTIHCDVPQYFKFTNEKYKVAFTMYEATKMPDLWRSLLNQMDLILVPCRFNRDVFISDGIYKPVRVVPLAARNAGQVLERVRTGYEPFTFLSWGQFDRDGRKGEAVLARAFAEEFEGEKNVKLILKGGPSWIFPHVTKEDPRIEFINKFISEEEMTSLMQRADCGVFPSKGEGWGLCPMEAAASGMPVIITNWSAMYDWAHPDYFYLLDIKQLEFANYPHPYYNCGYWAQVDVTELRKQMRYVFGHQTAAKRKGLNAAKYISKYYNWDNTARALVNILSEELKA